MGRARLNNEFKDIVIEDKETFITLLENILKGNEVTVIKHRVLNRLTLEKIGKLIGVNKQTVHKIESKAMRKLRAYWRKINNKDSADEVD